MSATGTWQTTAPKSSGCCVKAFRADLAAMEALIADPSRDLLTPLAHGDGQTLLREALLVADHNAYHVGELVAVRRLLGAWAE